MSISNRLDLIKGFLDLQLFFNFDIYIKSYDPSKFIKHRRLCGGKKGLSDNHLLFLPPEKKAGDITIIYE